MKNSDKFWRDHLNRYHSVIDPGTRIWEIVCGLIMVLTFTGSISAATGGHQEVKVILWAALGCNTAWGIVDGMMYLMSVMLEREQALIALKKVRDGHPGNALAMLREYLPPIVTKVMSDEQILEISRRLNELPELPHRTYPTWHDIRNAFTVFFLVFISTFPVVIPFLLDIDIFLALRISNGIVLLFLFGFGFYMGRMTGHNRMLLGLLFALVGALLVGITIALGG